MNRYALTTFAAAALMSCGAWAQQQIDFSKVEQTVTDLGNRTYMVVGAGGNTTVIVGGDGVIMVDSQFAPLHDKLKAAIDKLSGNKPIKYLVNTHWHGDHTGGNAPFAKSGVTLIAHQNVKKRLTEGAVNGLTGNRIAPAAPEAIPAKTYKSSITLKLQGRSVQLKHPAAAHTDGDTYVFVKDANVLSTGDIVSVGNRYPNIDFAVGGSIDGMIAAVDTYIKLSDDKTKVVPGHGPVMNKTQLRDYRAMLAEARARVTKLMNEGKSEQDIVAAKPLADIQARAGANDQQSVNFVRVIYNSLKNKAEAKKKQA